ncbi:hypothetical protein [Kribbella sp. CA-293567]|uniref:hypothetical protein n=1 Tax=Kribbella sp. CA-293567 TaxID=3002436 RepID=UPI0022DD4333|nr:hypothetical protein [Kribbella sp. CA-293567]WBQ05775.1 hypothetical protein OX958_02975 [Kribbella sp. CA-293567]
MLRPLARPLVTVAVAAVLLTGCSGGDDKKADSPSGDGGDTTAATPAPATPELPSFDPPKAFSPFTAVAQDRPEGDFEIDPGKAGMVGKTTLYANKTGLNGVWLDGSQSWQVPAKEIASTKVGDFAQPVAVQLDGKEVIATAYIHRVEAGGTQKAHGQVAFQWIDPADGKVLSSVAVDLSPAIGAGKVGGNLISHAYDPATGQVAISLRAGSAGAKSGTVTAYADPKTKKGSAIPDVQVAGVLNGTVVGAKGEGKEGAKNLALVVADGAAATIKKTVPVPAMNYLTPLGTGGKHAFVSGRGYIQDTKYDHHYQGSVYAVDIASGAVVETKLPNSSDGIGLACHSDHLTSTVCNYSLDNPSGGQKIQEIVAFDDATGKKSWGYSSASGSRVVPEVSTVYNGYVYGQAQTLPAVLDARTGEDVPVPTPTPGTNQSPGDGETPTGGETPTDGTTPTDGVTPSGDGSTSPGVENRAPWGKPSLIYGEPKSPAAVSKYGSTYLLAAGSTAPLGSENILVVQKAIG